MTTKRVGLYDVLLGVTPVHIKLLRTNANALVAEDTEPRRFLE